MQGKNGTFKVTFLSAKVIIEASMFFFLSFFNSEKNEQTEKNWNWWPMLDNETIQYTLVNEFGSIQALHAAVQYTK